MTGAVRRSAQADRREVAICQDDPTLRSGQYQPPLKNPVQSQEEIV